MYGYSFILTKRDVSTTGRLVAVERWYRYRTDIEALNNDAKHGAALQRRRPHWRDVAELDFQSAKFVEQQYQAGLPLLVALAGNDPFP